MTSIPVKAGDGDTLITTAPGDDPATQLLSALPKDMQACLSFMNAYMAAPVEPGKAAGLTKDMWTQSGFVSSLGDFDKADANKDGLASFNEFRFASADTDKNNTLSKEEWDAAAFLSLPFDQVAAGAAGIGFDQFDQSPVNKQLGQLMSGGSALGSMGAGVPGLGAASALGEQAAGPALRGLAAAPAPVGQAALGSMGAGVPGLGVAGGVGQALTPPLGGQAPASVGTGGALQQILAQFLPPEQLQKLMSGQGGTPAAGGSPGPITSGIPTSGSASPVDQQAQTLQSLQQQLQSLTTGKPLETAKDPIVTSAGSGAASSGDPAQQYMAMLMSVQQQLQGLTSGGAPEIFSKKPPETAKDPIPFKVAEAKEIIAGASVQTTPDLGAVVQQIQTTLQQLQQLVAQQTSQSGPNNGQYRV